MSYPRYKNYAQSKEAWIESYPSHWSLSRISQAARLVNGYPFDSTLFSMDSGTPLVRIRDIGSHAASINYNGLVPKAALIKTGDILVGMDGDFNVRMWAGGHAALNQRVACIRAKSSDLQKFIFYVLPFPLKIVNDLTYFTTVKHLSSSDIERAIFPMPPIDELKYIVKFLDRETAKIDRLIEKQQRLIELLEEKRHAVISHAVTKGLNPDVPMKDSGVEWLGEVPQHWDIVPIKHLCSLLKDGTHLPPPRVDDGIPLLSVRNIQNGEFSFRNDDSKISIDDYKALCRSFVPRNGDILLAIVGATLGKVAIVGEMDNFHIQRSLAIFRTKDNLFMPNTLRLVLASSGFQSLLWEHAGFSAQPGIYLGTLANFRVPVPPIDEQKTLVHFCKETSKKLDRLISKAMATIDLMQERRTALISAAVTGKIDVRDQVPQDVKEAVAS